MNKKNKKIKKEKVYLFWISAGLIFFAAVFFSSGRPSRVEAAPNSTVYLDPASVSPSLNSTFTLNAVINPGTNRVSVVDLRVNFDHTRVRLDSMTPNVSSTPGDFSGVLQPVQINNSNGTASVILDTGISTNYVTTTKTMATLVFTAIGSGSATVNLNGTVAAAESENTDVITTRTPATVTIGEQHPTYGIADFQNLVADWLRSIQGSPADVNADNVVNSRDLGIMMSYWLE